VVAGRQGKRERAKLVLRPIRKKTFVKRCLEGGEVKFESCKTEKKKKKALTVHI